MRGSSFRYLMKTGIRNLWRNRVMAFTSIGVLTTCLLLVGATYLLTLNVNNMVGFVEQQTEMSVILEEGRTSVEIDQIRTELLANDNVESIEFISSAQGLENQKAAMGDDGILLDGLPYNPIPDVFTVRVKDISLTVATQEQLRRIEGVETVNASGEVADTFTSLQRVIGTVGSAVILALGVISLVIIANTIRATIFARRKEINIMKFVGATNSFIRIPFLVEGFMLGLISAIIAFLAVWFAYHYLTQALTTDVNSFLQAMFAHIIPFEQLSLDLGIFFGVTGTVLGTFGSAISIRNHVRV